MASKNAIAVQGPSAATTPADALKVFVSYSRADMATADAMVTALEASGFMVRIDRRDLPYGEEWQKELAAFIAGSDTVVWLVSPDSVKSKWVNWELGEVSRLSKRLIPIKVRETSPEELPEALGKIHLLPAEGDYEPALHEADLVRALNTDQAWLKRATSLGEDARDWMASGRDKARLMRGRALTEAEAWSIRAPKDTPSPSSDILELILASRAAQRRGQRVAVIGSLAAAILAVGLAVTAVWFALSADEQAQEAERQKTSAIQQTRVAVANETRSLAALSQAASASGMNRVGVQLAMAAWPRLGDVERPTLRNTLRSLGDGLADLRDQVLFQAPSADVTAAISQDGTKIAIGQTDGATSIATLGSQAAPVIIEGPSSPIRTVAFSPDGAHVAVVSGTRADEKDIGVYVSDTRTGREILKLPGHTKLVNSVAYSDDGDRMVTASDDGIARIFDATTGRLNVQLVGHQHDVNSAVFSPDGSLVVTSSVDRTARVWDSRTGTPKVTFATHTDTVTSAAFSPDGRRIATSSMDNTARIWDAETGVELTQLRGHEGWVKCLTFSADGRLIATGSFDRTTRIWNSQTGAPLLVLRGHEGNVDHVRFVEDDARLLTISKAVIRRWNVTTAVETNRLDAKAPISSLSFSHDSKRILVATLDTSALLLDVKTGDLIHTFGPHSQPLMKAVFDRSEERIATASLDGTAKIWDSTTGNLLQTLYSGAPVRDVSFAPNGRTIVTAHDNGSAVIWNTTSGKKLMALRVGAEPVYQAEFSKDGSMIVTLSRDRVARLWSSEHGNLLEILNQRPYDSVAFSADGKSIWGAGSGLVWGLGSQSRDEVRLADTNDVERSSMSFSSDGSLATWPRQNEGEIFDTQTGILVGRLRGHDWSITTATFSPDGNTIATGAWDETIRLWSLDGLGDGNALDIACKRLGDNPSLVGVVTLYDLGQLTPICGKNTPLPVDWTKLQ